MSRTELNDTGERMIPELHRGKNLYGAHLARYQAGMKLVDHKTVLDIACGSGYGTKLISGSAKQVYGVDIDEKTISYAKKHFGGKNIVYKVGSATSIPLDDNSVDVVVSYETIEHIDDYQKFLQEVKRVLKPGGSLLLSTPNDDEYTFNNPFHLQEFSYPQLKKLIQRYFKYHADYFQTHWIYSSILPEELQNSEWSQKINTIGTSPIPSERSIFFLMLCSDSPIKSRIEPVGVIGEHYRVIDLQAANKERQEIKKMLDEARSQLNKVSNLNQNLQTELSAIKESKSWKAAMVIRKAGVVARKSIRTLRRGA